MPCQRWQPEINRQAWNPWGNPPSTIPRYRGECCPNPGSPLGAEGGIGACGSGERRQTILSPRRQDAPKDASSTIPHGWGKCCPNFGALLGAPGGLRRFFTTALPPEPTAAKVTPERPGTHGGPAQYNLPWQGEVLRKFASPPGAEGGFWSFSRALNAEGGQSVPRAARNPRGNPPSTIPRRRER